MKIFWSWQADTPGKTGRHFVRDVLADAIKALKEAEDIEEPYEREAREALHLDHDRKGVSGSPDLAPTIFKKIDQATVFVTDVTLVAQMPQQLPKNEKADKAKKLINSNVAIEYGYALHALKDERILMVQNTHYGERDELPFDLKHKAGPIQYSLLPTATKADITKEGARLCKIFIEALRPYLNLKSAPAQTFQEIPQTKNIASFWQPGEVLARVGRDEDAIEYRFDEHQAFYLRLIPTTALDKPLKINTLLDIVRHRRVKPLTRTIINSGSSDRNRFGAIIYEPSGMASVPTGFTQLFQTGEIWGVSKQLFAPYQGEVFVPMKNVENIYKQVITDYLVVAVDDFSIAPPYHIEMGAVGLENTCLSLPQPVQPWDQLSGKVYKNELRIRRLVNEIKDETAWNLTEEFLDELYDLAGISR